MEQLVTGLRAVDSIASVIVFPPFRLDLNEQQLWRGDSLVPIKPKAFALLRHLLEHPRQLITKEALVARFWSNLHISEGVLKTHIGEIRQALGDCAREPRFIETAHRRGYRFIGMINGGPPSGAPEGDDLGHRRLSSTPVLPFQAQHVVGREAELALLAERWARARNGDRQVVFVTGEAGVGKTVLVNTFLRERLALESGGLMMWGQCVDQYGAGAPYLPILEAIRRPCAEPGGELIIECLRQHAPAWFAQMPSVLASKVNGAADPTAFLTATPEQMLGQMAETLEALGDRAGVILLIEDLHWADYSTLDLLAYLAQRSDPARLLVLATYRPVEGRAGRLAELEGVLKARSRCVELVVPHLSERAVAEYLARRFTDHRLPTALPELLHQRTEGNALFMVGVIDGWLERGLLQKTDGACKLIASLDELGRCVPASFVRMIESELRELSALERNVLEAASVAGHEFSTAAVAAALSKDTVDVEELCMHWARREHFLKNKSKTEWKDGTIAEQFEFIHVLYQDVIYAQIGAARRAQLHRRIGERLEAGYADEASAIAAELALHFQRGQDYPRAVRYLQVSGEQALRQGAYHEAIDHLKRALELVAKLPGMAEKARLELDLCLLIAAPLRVTRGYAALEVEQAYARASELCDALRATSQRFLVMAGMGGIYILRGGCAASCELGEEFLRLAEEQGDRSAITEANLVLGITRHALGQHHAALILLRHSIESFEPGMQPTPTSLGGRHPFIVGRCFMAFSTCMLGYLDRARHEAEEALRLAQELADPFAMAFAHNFCSHIYQLRREPQLAQQQALALADLAAENGFGMFSALAISQQGVAQCGGPGAASGIQLLQTGWAALQVTGASVYSKYWVAWLAAGYGKVGQPEKALQIIEESLALESTKGERLWDAELLRIKGDLLLSLKGSGDGVAPGNAEAQVLDDAAEACLLSALRTAREQDAKLFELRAAVSLSRYWMARGHAARAHTLLADIYGWFSEGLATPDLVEARLLIEESRRLVADEMLTSR